MIGGVRYLRMFSNAVLGGALGAAFVAILILQINPQLPISLEVVSALYGRLLLFYGVNLGCLFYMLIVLRQLVARRMLSPGWISLRILAWLGTVLSGLAAALMWLNLAAFGAVLDVDVVRRTNIGAWALAGCALLLFMIAVMHYSRGRPASAVGATLFSLTVVGALILPLTARGHATSFRAIAEPFQLGQVLPPPPTNTRVTMILLDGASLSYITPATAEGRLPNFGKLLDGGAAMHLATIRPTQPAPAWAVATTGKLPQVNGVRSAATFSFGAGNHEIELLPDLCFARALVHLGLFEEHLNLSTTLRARPVWQILSAFGMSVGITGLPLTNPVFPVRGFLVSDRAHTVVDATTPGVTGAYVYPRDAFATPSPLGETPDAPVIDPPQSTLDPERLARDLSPRDSWYRAIARDLDGRFEPQLRAIRFDGIDLAGHYYLRFAQPRAFGDVSDADRRRLGMVIDQQYAAIDREIGARLAVLGPDDVLFVVSAFGMEPVSIGKRLLARALGEPDITGTHEGAPDGFLIAYGARVRKARLPVGSIADVTPTLLYLLGLPVGRDMQGTARTDLFSREFSETRPLTFIQTYDR